MTDTFELPLASIEVSPDRARDIDPAWAEGLARIIEAQGLTNPITVREVAGGHRLVTGLHRVEAFRLLGQETIPARLSAAASDDEARLEEVMENLGRNELIALDRCHHLYELRQVWQRMHPQAKHGGDRKSEAIKVQSLDFDPDAPEVFGFAEATAAKVGLSRAAIFAAVKIWKDLAPGVRSRLVGTDLARKQTELKALSELKPARQGAVLDLILGDSEATNVAQALQILTDGAVPSDTERRYSAACKAISSLPDDLLDTVVAAQEARIIASLKRLGRI